MSLTPRRRGLWLAALVLSAVALGWMARPNAPAETLATSGATAASRVPSATAGSARAAEGERARPSAEPHGSVAFVAVGADVGVTPEADAPRVQLGLTRVGRGGAHRSLERGTRELTEDGARYEHAELAEWFRETPAGLEHGMTIVEPLPGEGALELVVSFDGLDPVLMGTDVVLHDGDLAAKLVYRDLVVTDASGKRLPAAMAVLGRDVLLRVDDSSATYPVTVDPILTSQTAILTASDGVANDEFGGTPFESSGGPAVAIDGTLAVIAASYEDDPEGAVYVFQLTAGTWSQVQKLPSPPLVGTTSRFGWSVALSGTTLVVGAPLATGRAVVYTWNGTAFAQQAVLSDTDGEQFGCAVAVSGNMVAVGARYDDRGTAGGAVSVFRRVGTVWTLDERIKSPDGALGDDFGTQVAIDEATETLAVGAIYHPVATPTGAVYVFTEPAAAWTLQQKLVASDAAALDQFSRSLSLSGNRLLVGAPQNQVTEFNQGAAYVFDRSGNAWTQTVRLLASDADEDDQFGYGVALAPSLALIGARFDDVGLDVDAGSTYAYRNVGATWVDELRSNATVPGAGDRYGDSVAVSGTTALVGAPYRDSNGANSGAAYIVGVVLEKANGEACGGGAECDSGSCVDGVCCATACGGGTSDCQACSVAAGGTANGTCTALTAAFAPTVTCRSALGGECDAPEVCVAGQTACPADVDRANGTPCTTDGLTCTGAETCQAGTCTSAGLSCADTNACTADSCAEPGGCVNTPISCDDGNACTVDSCGPATGECLHAMIACDDGNACNGAETCNPAVGCEAGTAPTCDDADACNGVETCSPAMGCVPGTALTCDDADACNGVETCSPAMGCVPGTALSCDDADACNGVETCDATAGCEAGTALSCDDANVCNGAETCDATAGCEAGTALPCDDNDACTADSCDALTGCANTTVSCNDNDVCTADSCDALTGCANDAILGCCSADGQCNDNDSCTDDSCGGSNTCVFTDNGSCMTDAGVPDGGTMTDGGVLPDGGTMTDGGVLPDGGTMTDGGALPDGAVLPDADVLDGAVIDAGDDAATDAGDDAATGDAAVGDAGGTPDQGGGLTGGGGCGCTIAEGSSREPLAWLASGLLVGLVIRRRRARHPR